jgi:hypothetical protein
MTDKVELTASSLKKDIEDGLTRPEIANKYQLSVGSIKSAMQQCGLTSMKARRPKFTLVNDLTDNVGTSN